MDEHANRVWVQKNNNACSRAAGLSGIISALREPQASRKLSPVLIMSVGLTMWFPRLIFVLHRLMSMLVVPHLLVPRYPSQLL